MASDAAQKDAVCSFMVYSPFGLIDSGDLDVIPLLQSVGWAAVHAAVTSVPT